MMSDVRSWFVIRAVDKFYGLGRAISFGCLAFPAGSAAPGI